MIIVFVRIFITLFILCFSSLVHSTFLESFTVKNTANKSSVVSFSFDSIPKYNQFTLSKPSRIVFDFSELEVKTELNKLSAKTSLIKALRFSPRDKNNLRLVFDVEEGTKLVSKKLADNKGAELIITLAKGIRDELIKNKENAEPEPSELDAFILSKWHRDAVVVIDPGHGGKDPGAVGAKHHQEKNIVLKIAKKLKKMIDKKSGMKAYLTRSGDYYVGLRQRLALARKYNADIFISIHADAFLNRRSRGASVYSLSQRGATSEAARWLATSENYSELGGVDLSELDDDNGMIRSVLIDLSQTATNSSSLNLGKKVLGDLNNIALLHHDDVEQARFVVLKSPDIPSILVETGFISNRSEEKLLASNRYQMKLASSILSGVTQYFNEHPPRNSALAARPKVYQVVRGDTLSGIALKFKVSMNAIKKGNKLSSNRVYIGQKLEVSF